MGTQLIGVNKWGAEVGGNAQDRVSRFSNSKGWLRYFDPAAADSYSPDTRHGTVQEVQNDGNKQAIIQRKHLKKKLNAMLDPISLGTGGSQ